MNQLQNRPRWFKSSEDIRENCIVLIENEDTLPLQWPLGKVVETFRGSDGHVRYVRLKTSNGELVRPIVKICPLPQTKKLTLSIVNSIL